MNNFDPFNNDKPKKWRINPEYNSVESKRKQSNFGWFYNSKAWKTARNKCLQTNPLCVMCKEQGIVTEARTINHSTPLRVIVQSNATNIKEMTHSEYKNALSQDNLESLCLSCHGIEESEMIAREKQQLKKREEQIRQIEREEKRKEIIASRNIKEFDNFNQKIYTDENGLEIYMQIF